MEMVGGFHRPEPEELLCFMLHKRNEDGSLTIETLYSPTQEEIENLLEQYNLPIDYTMTLVSSTRSQGAHTALIEYDMFLEHLRSEGYRI